MTGNIGLLAEIDYIMMAYSAYICPGRGCFWFWIFFLL